LWSKSAELLWQFFLWKACVIFPLNKKLIKKIFCVILFFVKTEQNSLSTIYGGVVMDNSKQYDLIYQLDGRPPLKVVVPLGLQHVMAMFVGNLAPIFILTGAMSTQDAPFPPELRIMMIQCAMFVSGLATLLQLYPLKLGIIQVDARLPIVMGTAFAFVPTMQGLGAKLLAEQVAL